VPLVSVSLTPNLPPVGLYLKALRTLAASTPSTASLPVDSQPIPLPTTQHQDNVPLTL